MISIIIKRVRCHENIKKKNHFQINWKIGYNLDPQFKQGTYNVAPVKRQ